VIVARAPTASAEFGDLRKAATAALGSLAGRMAVT
jgi:hypothetical protein